MATYVPPLSTTLLFYGWANAGQTLGAANTPAPVLLPGEDVDDLGAHSLSTNTSRYTATQAGLHMVSGSVLFAASDATTAGSTLRVGFISRNGTRLPRGASTWGTYAGQLMTLPILAVPVTLAAGDYVELQASAGLASAKLAGDATDGSSLRVDFVR